MQSVTLGRDFGTKSEVLGGLDATDRVIQNPTEALHKSGFLAINLLVIS